jgi:aspartate oxidase
LASNSLLEGLVFAEWAAQDAAQAMDHLKSLSRPEINPETPCIPLHPALQIFPMLKRGIGMHPYSACAGGGQWSALP